MGRFRGVHHRCGAHSRRRDARVGTRLQQFLGKPGGLAAVNEWILLVGGLDQGTFLPSLSWIVGVRGQGGAEVGVGPNVSAAGVGLVAAAGVTYRATSMDIPLSFAVVPTRDGARVSIITGFTLNK